MSDSLNRREFLQHSALAAGAAALAMGAAPASPPNAAPAKPKRTATDIVTLGSTGLTLSRLGIGTGSNNGDVQLAAGKENFIKVIHHAFDQGITYIDTAKTYRTFNYIADATKGLPREKLFILSKLPDQPTDVLPAIDQYRKTFKMDYIDCLLVHCMYQKGWTDAWKKTMDGLLEAQDKKWIKSRGVSCHSLPALRDSIASDWTQVHLVRVNPQGVRIDGMEELSWNNRGPIFDVNPVVEELKNMKAKKRGVIGMKIMGNGEFKTDADREKSVRFAMSRTELDAVVIGFKSTEEIDKGIKMINTALAEAA